MAHCFQQKQKVQEEAKKQAEIDALQKQLQQLRDMNAGKAVSQACLWVCVGVCVYSCIIVNMCDSCSSLVHVMSCRDGTGSGFTGIPVFFLSSDISVINLTGVGKIRYYRIHSFSKPRVPYRKTGNAVVPPVFFNTTLPVIRASVTTIVFTELKRAAPYCEC